MAVPSASGSGIVNKGTTYGATSQVTSTNINAHVDDAVFNANAVDGTTINADSNGKNLFVVDGSISVAKTSFLGTVDTTANSTVSILSKQSDGQYDSVTPSGDVTMSQAGAFTIAAGAVEGTMLNSNTVDDSTIELSSNTLNVKDSGIGTAKIADSNVTLAKIANIADDRVLGNISGGSAAPSELTAANVVTMLGTSLMDPTSIDASTESVTFSNGLIVKFGSKTGVATQVISFDTAFPNSIYTVVAGPRRSDGGTGATQSIISAQSTSGFTMQAGSASGHINWIAVGR